ncbi:hypothetical protein BJ508DRAFT_363920 [Ascobolus immersus RN42]|uniref:Uncharacterized protein n=1 Tax=Ascobolus immersus RN42 TaxID=1160509 RepID=A0A3N4HXK8_ASCIM|nr:hypothetical protein BJ508DRAFT_363920 [Ascobolus immersus RN42]
MSFLPESGDTDYSSSYFKAQVSRPNSEASSAQQLAKVVKPVQLDGVLSVLSSSAFELVGYEALGFQESTEFSTQGSSEARTKDPTLLQRQDGYIKCVTAQLEKKCWVRMKKKYEQQARERPRAAIAAQNAVYMNGAQNAVYMNDTSEGTSFSALQIKEQMEAASEEARQREVDASDISRKIAEYTGSNSRNPTFFHSTSSREDREILTRDVWGSPYCTRQTVPDWTLPAHRAQLRPNIVCTKLIKAAPTNWQELPINPLLHKSAPTNWRELFTKEDWQVYGGLPYNVTAHPAEKPKVLSVPSVFSTEKWTVLQLMLAAPKDAVKWVIRNTPKEHHFVYFVYFVYFVLLTQPPLMGSHRPSHDHLRSSVDSLRSATSDSDSDLELTLDELLDPSQTTHYPPPPPPPHHAAPAPSATMPPSAPTTAQHAVPRLNPRPE